jgi:hypothetical protein
MLVPATVRCWWDAHVQPSSVWGRLAAEAEAELQNADLEVDWYTLPELYRIASEFAILAERVELRADLYMGTATA